MGQDAVEAGEQGQPYGWVIAPHQHDPVAAGRLVDLMIDHGVRVFRTDEPVAVGYTTYPAGTEFIPANQPYRAFLLTMLRPQRYPEVVPYQDGPIFPPYDVTSWSLPIGMGVEVVEIDRPFVGNLISISEHQGKPGIPDTAKGGYLIPHRADSAFIAMNRLLSKGNKVYWLTSDLPEGAAAGDIYLPAGSIGAEELEQMILELDVPVNGLTAEPSGEQLRVHPSRIGLYKPWVASMDEGWTRWVLERYEFPHLNLNNDDIKEGSFRGKVDVLLFPDIGADIIRKGEPDSPEARRWWTPLPDKYAGGLGLEGDQAIREWVEKGGTAVALDSSTAYMIELFQLPVTNVLQDVESDRFSAPGTMLRIDVDTEHPVGYGLRPQEAAYFAGSAAFETSIPDSRFGRRVVARFPAHRDDIPVSGYVKGTDLLERKAAIVDLRVGKGRVILIGFRPQHRAQTLRTFKFLFNALYLPGLDREEL